MTDRELDRRLKTALEHAAPDDLAAVLSRCGTGKGNVIDMKNAANTKKNKGWKMGLIAACLALVMLAGGGGLFYQQAYAVASVVSLDVNPSIELTVNKSEKVLSCTGLNQEGIDVLADMGGGSDLKGAKLDVAVNAIVGALVRSGYLDNLDSAILISVEDSDAARGARLQQELVASVDGVLQTAANSASVLSQNVTADSALDERAQRNNISTGNAYLIDQIVARNGELDFDALAALSVEELRDLLEIGAPDMPIGKDAALQAVLDFAGLTETGYTYADVDPELDERVPYYDVELLIDGLETDYGVHAFSGEVIQGADLPGVLVPGPALPQSDTAVTEDDAEAIALADAGVQPGAADRLTVKPDRDDGRTRYDVEFFADGYEFDYEIDGETGEIVSRDKEPDPRAARDTSAAAAPTPDPNGDIGEDAAIAAALEHAGLTQDQAGRIQCERDRDDGRVEYEIDFRFDGYEYEYTIDAASGAILDHERDRDD